MSSESIDFEPILLHRSIMIPKPQLTRKPWHATACLHTGEASLSLQESRGMPQHVYIRRQASASTTYFHSTTSNASLGCWVDEDDENDDDGDSSRTHFDSNMNRPEQAPAADWSMLQLQQLIFIDQAPTSIYFK